MPRIGQLLGTEPLGPTSFDVGDWVTGKDEPELRPELSGKRFRVVAIEEIHCTCGFSSDPDAKHANGCKLASVGHHQWVTLDIDGEKHVYSGSWLEKTE